MPENAAANTQKKSLRDLLTKNFGQSVGTVDENNDYVWKTKAELFWAPCENWNEFMIKSILQIPLKLAGPFRGCDLPGEGKKPEGGGFVIFYTQSDETIWRSSAKFA